MTPRGYVPLHPALRPSERSINLAEVVALGNAIARNTARKLHSLGYTPEQLSQLFPELGDADEIGVWVRQAPEVATSVGPTMALRARARELAAIQKEAVMVVEVKNNDVASALRVLKRKLMKAGQVGELKRRSAYEKPSERRNRQHRRAAQRARKMVV